jgi:hypothetical protein
MERPPASGHIEETQPLKYISHVRSCVEKTEVTSV